MLIIIFLTTLYYIIEYIVTLFTNSFIIRTLIKINSIKSFSSSFSYVIIIFLILSLDFSVNLRFNRISYRFFPLFFNRESIFKFESLKSLKISRLTLIVYIIFYISVD